MFAVALRLTADAINIAAVARAYSLDGGGVGLDWYWPRTFASHEKEVAQTLVGLVNAAMVEVLSRIWRTLHGRRLGQAKGAS